MEENKVPSLLSIIRPNSQSKIAMFLGMGTQYLMRGTGRGVARRNAAVCGATARVVPDGKSLVSDILLCTCMAVALVVV